MRSAIWLPNFGDYGDVRLLAELAREAEESGWDGFFLWDHVFRTRTLQPGMPVVDPWVALAAIAISTSRMRVGTMVTPVPRRRPWKLAREVVSLDHLSGGRAVLGVGIGAPPEFEFQPFGEPTDARTRAEKLDEGLELVRALWAGETVTHRGKHYSLEGVVFAPGPVQSPRVPIWVAATAPTHGPLRRAARWDGIFPLYRGVAPSPDDLRDTLRRIEEERGDLQGFDVAVSGATEPGSQDLVAEYRETGATWWLERIHHDRGSLEEMRARIGKGPPRV